MPETSATTDDGTRLAVTVSGEGPPLLLIPGLGATRVVFDPLLPHLTGARTVAVYDQRGVGGSDPVREPFTTATLGDDAAAVLAALGWQRAAVLGASFGGMVAQQLAVRHGEALSALVLAATGPGPNHATRRPTPKSVAALMGRGARTPEDAYRTACTVLYSQRFQRERPEFIDAQVRDRARRPVAARTFQAQRRAADEHDVWDELARVRAPVLVMHGEDDAVMPLENARRLAEHIRGSRLEVFAGAGHLFFHEEPERSGALILGFIGGSAGPDQQPRSDP